MLISFDGEGEIALFFFNSSHSQVESIDWVRIHRGRAETTTAWHWEKREEITYERASFAFIASVDAEKEKLSAIVETKWIELKLESALRTPATAWQSKAMVL